MLAQLGYEKLDDIIGRTDLLRPRDISLMKTQHLDLSYILSVRIYLISYILIMCNSFNTYLFYFLYLNAFSFISRMLGYQNGVVLKSGIKMFILMVLFWMMFY